MKKVLSTCRGWAVSCRASSDGGVNINLCGVCTGRWRKRCVSQKRCRELFSHGGTSGAHGTLARLKGLKRVPASWDSHTYTKADYKRYAQLDNEMEVFEKAYFKKCKPVTVQIRRR